MAHSMASFTTFWVGFSFQARYHILREYEGMLEENEVNINQNNDAIPSDRELSFRPAQCIRFGTEDTDFDIIYVAAAGSIETYDRPLALLRRASTIWIWPMNAHHAHRALAQDDSRCEIP